MTYKVNFSHANWLAYRKLLPWFESCIEYSIKFAFVNFSNFFNRSRSSQVKLSWLLLVLYCSRTTAAWFKLDTIYVVCTYKKICPDLSSTWKGICHDWPTYLQWLNNGPMSKYNFGRWYFICFKLVVCAIKLLLLIILKPKLFEFLHTLICQLFRFLTFAAFTLVQFMQYADAFQGGKKYFISIERASVLHKTH